MRQSGAMLHVPAPGGRDPYFASQDGRFALYHGNCMELVPLFDCESFDMIFADPPYFLSNDGVTCHSGKMVSVNKGKWDRSRGFRGNYDYSLSWLRECKRLLKPDGTIWISGTSHIIHLVGCALDELGYKILNDITWVKTNPPPNLSCRYFTHATETIIWAGRDAKCRHYFNYKLMKQLNEGKQMTSVWKMNAPGKREKAQGKHPTQKPLALLERIIAASTKEGDCILDPFCGSGTTGIAADRLQRRSVGLDVDLQYLELGRRRHEAESLNAQRSDILSLERDMVLCASPSAAQTRLFE
jgi:site-specific DNA-methyltransferase (adenine-specific)